MFDAEVCSSHVVSFLYYKGYQVIFETQVVAVYRSLALQWYKPDRGQLGKNGKLVILKCAETGKKVIQHIDSNGQMNIDADLVHEQLVNGAMKGNAGKTLAFYVTLKNRRHAIGGTYVDGAKDHHSCVGQRRFTWFFKHPGALALAVYHILDEDSKWVDLFYDEKSIFFVDEEEGLPHEVVPATGAMEVDRIPVAGITSDDELDYDVGGCSQLPG